MTKEEIIHRLQYARHRIENITYAPDVLKAIDIAIETVVNTDTDTISRQAAIDALRGYLVGKRCPDDGTLTCRLIENEVINKLPPTARHHTVSEL